MLIGDIGWNEAPWNGNPELQQRMSRLWNMSQHGLVLEMTLQLQALFSQTQHPRERPNTNSRDAKQQK